MRGHFLLRVKVCSADVPLHEAEDGGPDHVEVKQSEDLDFEFANLTVSDRVVDQLEDRLEVRRVDLFVLARNVQGGDAETLEVGLLKVLL